MLLTETLLLTEPPPDRDPLEGTWDQAARQEVTSYRDPSPVDRQKGVKQLPCPKLLLRVVVTLIIFVLTYKIYPCQ